MYRIYHHRAYRLRATVLAFVLAFAVAFAALGAMDALAETQNGEVGSETPVPMQVSVSPEATEPPASAASSPAAIPEDRPLLVLEGSLKPLSASPGDRITLRLPLVINPELTPGWTGTVQSLVVTPLPDQAEDWPLGAVEAHPQRSLPDLSAGARVEAIFTFVVESTAGEGAYLLPFGVSYGVMDELGEMQDGYEVLEYPLQVELSGTMVSVGTVSSQGLLALDTEKLENQGELLPQGEAGGELTIHLPLINNGDELTEISIAPKISSSLSEFPFVVDGENLVQSLDALQPGESANVNFAFQVDGEANAGRVPVQFTAVYRDGERLRESHYVIDVEILSAEESPVAEETTAQTPPPPSEKPETGGNAKAQARLYIVNYTVDPSRPVGGEEFTLGLTLQNESEGDTWVNLRLSISSLQAEQGQRTQAVTLAAGEESALQIDKIAPLETRRQALALQCSEKASSGVHVLSVVLDYEDEKGKQYQTVQPVTLHIVQPSPLTVGTPAFAEGEEAAADGAMILILPLRNEGRSPIDGVRVRLQSEDWKMADGEVKVSLQPQETRELSLVLQPRKSGALQGEISVEYANTAGEPVVERVALRYVQNSEEKPREEREIDEEGYWVLRDESGNIIQRIDPQTGEPVKEEESNATPLLVASIALMFLVGSLLGFWFHKKRGGQRTGADRKTENPGE